MILLPMKCKLCGKVISPPDAVQILGQPPLQRNQMIFQKLMAHMNTKLEEEQKLVPALRPHTDAMVHAMTVSQNLNGALVIGIFELSSDMETERQDVIRRVHEITRQVRIGFEELCELARTVQPADGAEEVALRLMLDLRDRYEGLGKYAPAAPAQPELVKP